MSYDLEGNIPTPPRASEQILPSFDIHSSDQLVAEANKHGERHVSYGQVGKLHMTHEIRDTSSKLDQRIKRLQKKNPAWTVEQCIERAQRDKEKKDRELEEKFSHARFNPVCVHCDESKSKHYECGIYGALKCPWGETYYEEVSEKLQAKEEKTGRKYLKAISTYEQDGDWRAEDGEVDDEDESNTCHELSFCNGTDCCTRKCAEHCHYCSKVGLSKDMRRSIRNDGRDADLIDLVNGFVTAYNKAVAKANK